MYNLTWPAAHLCNWVLLLRGRMLCLTLASHACGSCWFFGEVGCSLHQVIVLAAYGKFIVTEAQPFSSSSSSWMLPAVLFY